MWESGKSMVTNMWEGMKSVMKDMLAWLDESISSIPILGEIYDINKFALKGVAHLGGKAYEMATGNSNPIAAPQIADLGIGPFDPELKPAVSVYPEVSVQVPAAIQNFGQIPEQPTFSNVNLFDERASIGPEAARFEGQVQAQNNEFSPTITTSPTPVQLTNNTYLDSEIIATKVEEIQELNDSRQ